jgi:hypothetical protein
MNSVPGADALGEIRRTCGLELRIRIVTPPCCVAPSRAVKVPYCRPAPTVTGSENSEMPGAVTVTGSLRNTSTPGAEALTTVSPGLMGSNATPPAATVVGELDCPGKMVTVRV